MHNDYPTSGDYAWAEASSNSRAIQDLAKRVAYLEEQLGMRYEPPAPEYKRSLPFGVLVDETFPND